MPPPLHPIHAIFHLTHDCPVRPVTIATPCADAKYLFDPSGSIVAAGELLNYADLSDVTSATIGSEHWMSEESDFYRFEMNGRLHSLALRVPARNALLPPVTFDEKEGYFSLELLGPSFFSQSLHKNTASSMR